MDEKVSGLQIPEEEIELTSIRAQGAGGQNVNKVSSAIHLRFDIRDSSLPEKIKSRLLQLPDRRVNRDGTIVIKAQRFRTRGKNRRDALERLHELVTQASRIEKQRKATRPTRASKMKRLEGKNRRGKTKFLRGPVKDE